MATYHAIAAVGEALLRLLADACPKPEFAGAQFNLYSAADFQSAMEEGVALFLYRVTPNTAGYNLAPRLGADGRRYRPPLALDLHYLLISFLQLRQAESHYFPAGRASSKMLLDLLPLYRCQYLFSVG